MMAELWRTPELTPTEAGLGFSENLIAVTKTVARINLCLSTMWGHRRHYSNIISELELFTYVLYTLQLYWQGNLEFGLIQTLCGLLQECLLDMRALLETFNSRGGLLFAVHLSIKDVYTFSLQIIGWRNALLLVMVSDKISLPRAIDIRLQEAKPGTQNTNDETSFGGKRAQVLHWIYPGDFCTLHIQTCSERKGDIGQWILKVPEFQGWVNGSSSSRLLWGHGIFGSGKTFMCSLIIDHLISQARAMNYGVAYIYFSYTTQKLQKPIHVISSLLKQLASQIPYLPQQVEDFYDELQSQNKAPTLESLYSTLLIVTKLFTRNFFVFDALDKCHKTERLELLPLFHRMGSDGIGVFLTSREEIDDIQIPLRNSARVQISASDEDIASHIERTMDEDPQARYLIIQENLRDRIISYLTDAFRESKFRFLLVYLGTKYICRQTDAKEMLVALESIRDSGTKFAPLGRVYNMVIEDLRDQSQSSSNLAIKILSWLVKAGRAMTVRELQVAVSIGQKRYRPDEPNLSDREVLLRVCGGLISIDEAEDTVLLSRNSVEEYLLQELIINQNASLELAMICTTFLLYDTFAQGACDSASSFDNRCRLHPFLLYAAQNLSFHLKECGEDLSMEFILKFLGSPGSMSSYWEAFYSSPKHREHPYTQFPKTHVSLHVAVTLGHCSAVRHFLEGIEVISLEDRGWKLVSIAAFCRHKAVIELFLEMGIDISVADTRGITVLHSAAASGDELTVLLVLGSNADISARSNDGLTALHLATVGGHWPIVSLLLRSNADISASNNEGLTALHLAAVGGDESIVSLLLRGNADTSARNNEGLTALHLAAVGGHWPIVSLLLKSNADISARNNKGLTALHLAAVGGHESIVSLLLSKGAGISLGDNKGETALHKAAIEGHESIVLLLLVKGANAKTEGQRAIQPAKGKGYVAIVQLLEKGPHVRYELQTEFYKDWVVHTIDCPAQGCTEHKSEEKWERKEEIGTGGFAAVYLEEETEKGRLRAVKQLSRNSNTKYAQELNALVQLIGRPDLFVQLYGWYEGPEHIFIAMEYIKHGDLSKYIETDEHKAKSNAKAIASQILNGLVFLHDKNICHRDLKPQNVLVACLEPLQVKITDFGISKSEEAMNTCIGTQPYMAPEIHGILPRHLKHKPGYTKMVDIWAFGCLIHKILTSETPFIRRPDFETAYASMCIRPSDFETARECAYNLSSLTVSYAPGSEDPTSILDLTLLMDYCKTGNFPDDLLKDSSISEEGIGFVKGLLAVNPKSRMSAHEALASQWLESVRGGTTREIP